MECRQSVARLCEARAAFWRMGAMPAELEAFWQEARRVLPHWPGFARMELAADARQDFVRGERDAAAYRASEEAVAAGAERTQWQSSGGGRRTRLSIEVQRPKRPWWRFWSCLPP